MPPTPRSSHAGTDVLIIADDALPGRRDAVRAGGPLGGLFDSLAHDLSPWVTAVPAVPSEKALLSRAGGRCESCGAALEFDPASPRSHRCASCGRVHEGALHDRAWLMPYQLWLAERALQGALLHLLRGAAAHAGLARGILRAYADRYVTYPNTDNVLGPTRVFFSTYLESIWLLQVCLAADFLSASGDQATADIVRTRIVEPSSAIVSGYNEGMSNRQVWNNAALIAASVLLRRDRDLDALVNGPSGVEAHLALALLPDGTWYEGENYHQFALRGLWYCVTMLEVAGVALRDDLRERFQRAFAAPFVTALPDFTMPSRKDSPYAVSLRQWRLAELTELGFARRRDPILGAALLRMYGDDVERRDTGRSRSTADVERNTPASALTRVDLGWRALLHALPTLPRLTPVEPRSAILESQGYAVFRREGGIYVGFEFGQSGGGHGHPDRLNLTLYQNETRWLDDLGTGSYVDPSLHWYRSTLAHNAPLVNGKSQPIRDGTLLAYDEREGLGWIVGELRIPEEEVRLERAIVVAPDYLIDELRWSASDAVTIDLPWHCDSVPVATLNAALELSARPEDGFVYLGPVKKGAPHESTLFARGEQGLVIQPLFDGRVERYATDGPGQPSSTRRAFSFLRVVGRSGTLRSVVSLTGSCQTRSSSEDDVLWVQVTEGEWHGHRRDDTGWHVQLEVGSAKSTIDLAGFRTATPTAAPEGRAPRAPMRLHAGAPLVYQLGESHYRRSEVSWRDAGAPTATISICAGTDRIELSIDVRAGEPIFAEADAENPYDNEHPDTMRAGVQLYVRSADQLHAWMLVPDTGSSHVRARSLAGDPGRIVASEWHRTAAGYAMHVVLAQIDASFAMDAIVNETVSGRERRRGQLVLSGARGEFVYLRGDRHETARLIPMVVVP